MGTGTRFAQRNITMTFVCPNKRYNEISFLVEAVYGVHANYSGTMKIATGVGMATGVGVHLLLDGTNVIYRNPFVYNEMGIDSNGKYPIYHIGGYIPSNYYYDPSEPTLQKFVNLTASLIRLPEPLQAGQIKAAAIFHIRYN